MANAACVHGHRVGRRGHRAWRAGGHGMLRARKAAAEVCTASGYHHGHGVRRPSRTWDAASVPPSRWAAWRAGGQLCVRARPAWQATDRRGHRARRASDRSELGMRRAFAAVAKVGMASGAASAATKGLLRSRAVPQRGTSGPSGEARTAARCRRTAVWQAAMPCSALLLQRSRVVGHPSLVRR